MTRVEWIESTGDQYIVIGDAPAVGMVARIDLQFTGNLSATQIAYGCGAGGSMWFGNVNGNLGIATNKTVGSSSTRTLAEIAYESGATVATNLGTGVSVRQNRGDFVATHKLSVFASFAGTYQSSMRLWSLKITNNGALVRDLLPFRDGSEGCLYDLVTRSVLRNAGTGSFLCGTDVAGGGPRIPGALHPLGAPWRAP